MPIGDLKAGALYSIYNGDESRTYGVVKLLVLEPPVSHICVFSNEFEARPEQIDPDTLSLGIPAEAFEEAAEDDTLGELMASQGFGIAHMPVHVRDFVYGWQPVYLMDSEVTEEDLVGYNHWKEGDGGVFGGS